MPKLQINPRRAGTNAGAKGGKPSGFSGAKKGGAGNNTPKKGARSTGLSVAGAKKNSGSINLGSNR